MQQDVPKQFIHVNDKPVLIYTMESFQKHPLVDSVLCVCLDGWHDVLRAYAKQFGITKLSHVVVGGATGMESIRNGVFSLEGICKDDDIVIIHDGIRPLVDEYVISDVIRVCQQHGNAVTSLPYNDQIFLADNADSSVAYLNRDTVRRVMTPQAYRFGKLDWAYHKAFDEGIGIHGSVYANTLMVDLGERLWFAAGSEKNIKLTIKEDFDRFRCYLNLEPVRCLK
jgi:2-C-methyl-D-erythritol 4-phosphate cytidylyltransferase